MQQKIQSSCSTLAEQYQVIIDRMFSSLARRHRAAAGSEPAMRLTQEDIDAIKRTAAEIFGSEACIWLFGSRTDENRRGGDIDLMVENIDPDWEKIALQKARFLARLKTRIGDQRIDLVVHPTGSDQPRAIAQAAHRSGIRL